jgi:hypothetical protein
VRHAADAPPLLKSDSTSPIIWPAFDRSSASPPFSPLRTPRPATAQTRSAFKAAARAVTVPPQKPVRKKTTKRRGEGQPFSTEWIVDDYLCLCRDPLSDLQRWIKEDKKKPSFPRIAQQTRHGRQNTAAAAQRFLRDALHELSGRIRAQDHQGRNSPDVPHRSRAGAGEHRELQQVQAERHLTRPVRQVDDFASRLAVLHGHYATRIAAARATMRPAQAQTVIRNLRNEKIVAIRNAKNSRRAERAMRKLADQEPIRPVLKAAQHYRRCE